MSQLGDELTAVRRLRVEGQFMYEFHFQLSKQVPIVVVFSCDGAVHVDCLPQYEKYRNLLGRTALLAYSETQVHLHIADKCGLFGWLKLNWTPDLRNDETLFVSFARALSNEFGPSLALSHVLSEEGLLAS